MQEAIVHRPCMPLRGKIFWLSFPLCCLSSNNLTFLQGLLNSSKCSFVLKVYFAAITAPRMASLWSPMSLLLPFQRRHRCPSQPTRSLHGTPIFSLLKILLSFKLTWSVFGWNYCTFLLTVIANRVRVLHSLGISCSFIDDSGVTVWQNPDFLHIFICIDPL